MLIATLLDMVRRWHDVLPLTPGARQNLRARRELASLSPELQRDTAGRRRSTRPSSRTGHSTEIDHSHHKHSFE
ncbi:hypothetical protein [Ciceribacter selenitireducens]|uniref:hypothetical protein n=1 Tax=Ciceribacter selenitireducens TaxID=448181 RepID=UPI0011C01844|nr:hypothetical protein [Ciceribacter selenitireducens]